MGEALEQHLTVQQIAEAWGLSDTYVRQLFQDEPGVMRIGNPTKRLGRKLKRSYYTLRIPESVAAKVHRRLTATERARAA